MGKPVRGQRTWSNAWGSFFNNVFIRRYIGLTVAKINKDKKPVKMNWKLAKKKFRKGKSKKKKYKTVTELFEA